MSHVIEFTIAGLAGRKELYATKLNRDLNIFFGLNGSGKTSLLKILHSAMSNDASILQSVPFTAAQVKIYTIMHDVVFTRSIEKKTLPSQPELILDAPPVHAGWTRLSTPLIVPISVTHSFEEQYRPFFFGTGLTWKTEGLDEKVTISHWEHRYLPTTRLCLDPREAVPRHSVDTSPERTEEILDRFFARTLSQLWLTYSAELNSQVRKIQEIAISDILRNVLAKSEPSIKTIRDVDIDKAYDRVASFLRRQTSPDILGPKQQFARRYRDDPGLRDVVDQIDRVERDIDKTMAARERLETLIHSMFTGNKSITFRDSGIEVEADEHNKIGLESLSSGEKHVLKLFIETLLANNNSIMIDEPELSLHVDWQRRLVENMTLLNASPQYIFATHSPEIMADVDDSKIFRL
jgi:predicted ATPase